MDLKRAQTVASASAQSRFIPESCDAFAARDMTLDQQHAIAELAFQFWLERAFRAGSPQEDWLRAQRLVQQRRRASRFRAGA